MKFSFGTLHVRISFFFAVGMCLFSVFCPWQQVAALITATLLHESMHLICLHHFGKQDMYLTVGLFGMRLNDGILEHFGYRQEIVTVLSAPLLNLLCFVLLLPVMHRNMFFYYSTAVHLSLALFNFLPLRMLDGGRALHCILLSQLRLHTAQKVMNVIEIMAFFILMIALFFVGRTTVSGFTFFAAIVYLSFLFLFRK